MRTPPTPFILASGSAWDAFHLVADDGDAGFTGKGYTTGALAPEYTWDRSGLAPHSIGLASNLSWPSHLRRAVKGLSGRSR